MKETKNTQMTKNENLQVKKKTQIKNYIKIIIKSATSWKKKEPEKRNLKEDEEEIDARCVCW